MTAAAIKVTIIVGEFKIDAYIMKWWIALNKMSFVDMALALVQTTSARLAQLQTYYGAIAL